MNLNGVRRLALEISTEDWFISNYRERKKERERHE